MTSSAALFKPPLLQQPHELLDGGSGVPDQAPQRTLSEALVERDAYRTPPLALEEYVRAFPPHFPVSEALECPYRLPARALRQLGHRS